MNLFGLLLIFFQICRVESAPKRLVSRTPLDCTKHNADGLYVRGCSSRFVRCFHGKRYDYICPKKLKFNPETAKCEQRRQIIACINNADDDRIIVKAVGPFDCSKKKDGVYGRGRCSTTYYHCSRGHSTEMICPAGLFYNDKLKGCDDVDSIDACDLLTALRGFDERRESHLGEKGKHIVRDLMRRNGEAIFDEDDDYSKSSTRSLPLRGKKHRKNDRGGRKRRTRQTLYRTKEWRSETVLNCTFMNDGDYPMVHNQCSKHFWRCLAGKTTGRTCRDKLFFNTVSWKCDTAKNISECKDVVNEPSDDDKALTAEKRGAKPDCATNFDDGPVEHSACSRLYYMCLNGKLLELECPEDQVYDARRKRCESVLRCATRKNTSSPLPSNSLLIARIVSAPELSNLCAENGDGLYSAGCENYFNFCASGNGYHVNCPNGLFFDVETRTCGYKEKILACNSSSEHSGTTDDKQGHHYTSSSERTYRSEKKQGGKNDVTQSRIVLRVRTPQVPEAALPALMGIPLSNEEDFPFLPEDFDCNSKANGLYSIGCKTEYVMCINSRMFFFKCPEKLIFDEETKTCNHVASIHECRDRIFRMEEINEHESSLFMIPTGTPRKIPRKEKSEQVDAKLIHNKSDFCGYLNDGIYFEKCGKEYVICSKHIAFRHSCPTGQLMDPTSKTCDEPENIPHCHNNNNNI